LDPRLAQLGTVAQLNLSFLEIVNDISLENNLENQNDSHKYNGNRNNKHNSHTENYISNINNINNKNNNK
jgi:hypothetical protein